MSFVNGGGQPCELGCYDEHERNKHVTMLVNKTFEIAL